MSEVRARGAQRTLTSAGAFFAITVMVHNADHLRRGANLLHSDVFAIGISAILLEVMLVVLVFQRHPVAPLAAVLGGAALALGYIEVHFLPAHALLSDSFINTPGIGPLSWLAASFEIVGALALITAGGMALTRRDEFGSHRARPRPLLEAISQPVPLILIVTQTAAIALSVLQFRHG